MTEHTLILLRHGKSDWSGDEPDQERPLAMRGRRQAPQAGRWLDGHVPHLDLAVVSPAERARSTWDLVAAELGAPPEMRVDDRVYAASGSALLRVVRELFEDLRTVVVVGHNPGLEDLASTLVVHGLSMPTSALAVIDLPHAWSAAGPGTAELRSAGRPPA
jgi:phosphohistidine phosphatase